MSLVPMDRLDRWRQTSQARGRRVLSAEKVDIFFAFRRHQQTVLFDTLIGPEQAPEFLCVYPARTWVRGDIAQWIWEITEDGKTRLWVPTELSWRSLFIGEGIGKVIALDGKIAGSAGLGMYRRTDCWWVSFFPV